MHLPEQEVQSSDRISYDFRKGKYIVFFDDHVYEQRLCEFLNTYNFLKNIDLELHLLSPGKEFDIIKVPLFLGGRNLKLSITRYIYFREMYLEEMYRLRLENLLASLKISFS